MPASIDLTRVEAFLRETTRRDFYWDPPHREALDDIAALRALERLPRPRESWWIALWRERITLAALLVVALALAAIARARPAHDTA